MSVESAPPAPEEDRYREPHRGTDDETVIVWPDPSPLTPWWESVIGHRTP